MCFNGLFNLHITLIICRLLKLCLLEAKAIAAAETKEKARQEKEEAKRQVGVMVTVRQSLKLTFPQP